MYDPYEDEEQGGYNEPDICKEGPVHDEYLDARVLMPRGDEYHLATVRERTLDKNGRKIGKENGDPLLDTRYTRWSLTMGNSANIPPTSLHRIYTPIR